MELASEHDIEIPRCVAGAEDAIAILREHHRALATGRRKRLTAPLRRRLRDKPSRYAASGGGLGPRTERAAAPSRTIIR